MSAAELDLGFTSRDIDGPNAEFAKVAWLYSFEEYQRDDDPIEDVVDEILTAYWP